MAKHRGESSKMGQAGPLPQADASGLQVQTRSQTAGAAHGEHNSEHDEREVRYTPRAEEAQSGAPTGKRSHKERLLTMETRLDVLEASLEELYQGQGRLLGVESSQEAESRIDRVESLVDQLTEDTKDSVRHLHEVVAELTAKSEWERCSDEVGGARSGAWLVSTPSIRGFASGRLIYTKASSGWGARCGPSDAQVSAPTEVESEYCMYCLAPNSASRVAFIPASRRLTIPRPLILSASFAEVAHDLVGSQGPRALRLCQITPCVVPCPR
ncbi:hypothetical protein BHM03_00026491 [Ensete ventricosum]|nr:hypothetical protein BHM03_00026491 [Ensete ventricosum]